MHQQKNTQRIVMTGLAALLTFTMLPAATVQMAGDGCDETRKLEGIRSYGPGGVRQEPDTRPAGATREESNATRAATPAKISGASMLGDVNVFALTPDGQTAVYIADQETLGLFELYSVPVDGSAVPTKISDGLAFDPGELGVELFQISSTGAHVVFLADPNTGGGSNDVFSAPIGGGVTPVQLNAAAEGPVIAVGIAPDGSTVAFFGNDTSFGGGATEVYKATIGVADSGIQLSDASAVVAGHVVAADFSPDSSRLAYAADSAGVGVLQWHSVPFSATGPGSDIVLSDAMGSVSLGAISPDGTTLVYAADETDLGVAELFSVPLTGGSSTQLNPVMNGFGVVSLRISADSTHVAYLADQVNSGIVEVFGAQIGLGGSGMRLNQLFVGSQSADVVTFAPDSRTVIYEADETTAGTFDLMSAQVDVPGSSMTLDAMTPPNNAGFFSGQGTPVIGNRVVYPVVGAVIELYSVPFAGFQPATRINHTLAVDDTVSGIFIPDTATRLTAYGVGLNGGITDELFVRPIRADFPEEQVNLTAGAGDLGVLDYGITSDEVYVVWAQDQETSGRVELFSAELDSDGDGAGNGSDNCVFVNNPAQTAVVFGQTVRATTASTFVWDTAVDARYARGPLASVSTLTTDATGTLIDASFLDDTETPGSGAGFFYLFAVDCPGRSYQTGLGAEPGRDTAGLP